MATYVNDLRLTELATGEGSGTWGTTTNTNLELIGEALGYGTQNCFASDADATTTVADGASDPARSLYFKVTSSATLTATRVLTIAPNTVSRVMFIENATTGSQSITISQGSGANVTIATGKTAVVYLDGAGSGAAVVDAMALVDPGVTDTLAEVLVAGNTSSGTNIELTTTDKVQFRDSAIYINSSADGQLDIVADTEVQIATTTVDLNGILDVSGNTTLGADVTFTGASYNAVWDSSDNALEFADNAKAVFGAGDDLQIYHDGSNSYIVDNGTGDLLIRAENNLFLKRTNSDETYLSGAVNGAVTLFHNNNAKIATTISGIDVTGTVTADGLTVDGTSVLDSETNFVPDSTASNKSLVLASTGATGGSGQYGASLAFSRINTDSPRAAIAAENTDSNFERMGLSFWTHIDNTPSNMQKRMLIDHQGDITFYDSDGTTTSFFYDASGGLTINEAGADRNFRVESDANDHMLFVDAGGDFVTVGSNVNHVAGKLFVNGNIKAGYSNEISMQYNVSGQTSSYHKGMTGTSLQTTSARGLHIFNFDNDSDEGINFYSGAPSGTSYQKVKFSAGQTGEIVFNENSYDQDFRVESNGNTHALYVNAGSDGVGMGATSSPVAEAATEGLFYSIGGSLTVASNTETLQINRNNTGGNNRVNIGLYNNGTIRGTIGTLGGQDGLYFQSGGNVDNLQMQDGATIFNESSADLDFRVESNNNANMLFVDAGNDHVIVGGSVNYENATLQVQGAKNLVVGIPQEGIAVTDTTAVAAGVGGGITFNGVYNSGGDVTNFASVEGEKRIATSGHYDGVLVLKARTNGTNTHERARFDDIEAVINGEGRNTDFRVESDNNTHMLFVDAGSDHVNIGTSTDLGGKLNVDTSIYIAETDSPLLLLRNTGNSDTQIGVNSLGAGLDSFFIAQYAGIAAGEWDFRIVGATRQFGFIRGGVVNEGAGDSDFRVESNSNANALFVDASAGTVNINYSTGTKPTSAAGVQLQIGQNNNASQIFHDGTTTNKGFISGTVNDDYVFYEGPSTGNWHERLRFVNGGEAVFNDSSLDRDFRIESDSNAHLIFGDASDNQIRYFISAGTGLFNGSVAQNGLQMESTGTLISQSSNNANLYLSKPSGYSISNFASFYVNSTGVGSITTNGTTTAYNTSSDQRLKENITDADDAGELIDAIQVRQFDWIADGEHQRYGVVAQELNTVAPEAVFEGETEEDMMAVDYSKLVPMLIKEIQSLRARVAELESN